MKHLIVGIFIPALFTVVGCLSVEDTEDIKPEDLKIETVTEGGGAAPADVSKAVEDILAKNTEYVFGTKPNSTIEQIKEKHASLKVDENADNGPKEVTYLLTATEGIKYSVTYDCSSNGKLRTTWVHIGAGSPDAAKRIFEAIVTAYKKELGEAKSEEQKSVKWSFDGMGEIQLDLEDNVSSPEVVFSMLNLANY